jgi:hypothetical protein
MRFALLLLAVLGLLVSPGLAAAKPVCAWPAQLAGRAAEPGAAQMTAKAMAEMAPMRCCDPTSKRGEGHRSCADMCAGLSLEALDIVASHLAVSVAFTSANAIGRLADPAHSFEPAGLERPPKSMS